MCPYMISVSPLVGLLSKTLTHSPKHSQIDIYEGNLIVSSVVKIFHSLLCLSNNIQIL